MRGLPYSSRFAFKNLRWKLVLMVLFTTQFAIGAKAQQFGGNKPATRWKQINTDTARIIYPLGLDSLAKKVAGIVHVTASSNPFSLGNKLSKIDIVLQNTPVTSNGYVNLGPYRSEFYITPPADNFDEGSLHWATQLTLHEYRHVQQYNNFNNGLSKVAKRLLGQEGYSLAVNAAIPNWFFEGDAVHAETALSQQGRGRLPFFLKAYPTLWIANKNYSWMKLRNGSLKDYVPNHYELGYLLVNYGYEKYGSDFWKKVTHDASAYKGLLYPMQKAVNTHAGISYKQFVADAFNFYKAKYNVPSNAPFNNEHNRSDTDGRSVINYYYPFRVNENELLYIKSSYRERPAFYLKTGNIEKRIRLRDISIDEQYSYRNGKVVYAAYQTHPRWRWNTYSVLKVLDIHTGLQETIGSKTRLFSPDISEDGNHIVANRVNHNGQSSLVLLNRQGGLIKEVKRDDIAYFANPKLVNNNSVYAAIRKEDGTTNIAHINLQTSIIDDITPPANIVIGQIHVKEDKIYFTASQHLQDVIFYYDVKQKALFKLQTGAIGNYFVNYDYGKITWSSFTANGYRLSQLDSVSANWEQVSVTNFVNAQQGIPPVSNNNVTNTLPQRNFSSTPYPALTRPFNFHSWRPNYANPEFSFTLYGNNILNTASTEVYYLYNENDRTHSAGGAITYGGVFPYISLGSLYTFNRTATILNRTRQWNQWDNYVGASIPLTWVNGRTFKTLNTGTNFHYRYDFAKTKLTDTAITLNYGYLNHYISWAQQVQSTVQDIYPRWGYHVAAQHRWSVNHFNSSQTLLRANVYLPGIAMLHRFVLGAAWQNAARQRNIFGNQLSYARGFIAANVQRSYTLSGNYHFPIAYPDIGFANILYVKRVRGNLFYDFTNIRHNTVNMQLQSAGAELYFDTNWWNVYPLSLGIRAGRVLSGNRSISGGNWFVQFILPTTLIPR